MGLVGPQDKTEQSVLPGSDADEVGTVPTGPVGPDVTVDRIQPVGQYITCRPVGPDGMLSTNDSDQPTADCPVGRFITRNPLGSDRMFSMCDPDRPVADGPVGQSFILGPVGPRGCSPSMNWISQWLLAQWASRLQPARLGEQWENMSTSSIDMESEQNERPTNGSQMGRRDSDTRVPPNTEEDEDINDPWTDCMLNE